MTTDLTCRCGRPLTRQAAVHTRAGILCKRCSDHLPKHLTRPPKPQPKAKAS
jgi:hypothetical protein